MLEKRDYKRLIVNKELFCGQIARLKYLGFWMLPPSYPSFVHRIYAFYKILVFSVMFTFAITVLADICANFGDLSRVTDGGCIFAGIFVVLFKAVSFQFQRQRVLRLIEETMECGEELCDWSNIDVKSVVRNYSLRSSVSYYGFSALGFVLVAALMALAPEGALPIKAKYPCDITTSPCHQMAFAIEAITVSAGMVSIVSTDSSMITVINALVLISDVLNANFENCRGNDDKFHEDFVERYKQCLKFHQRLVKALADYNRIFSSSTFVQMVSSTSMICLAGFQMTVVGGQSSDILRFGTYFLAAVSQLLYTCWVGNELIYSCSCVGRSQWLSNWNSRPFPEVGSLVILSTMFSRQSFRLKAGGFYNVSLEAFISIMRGSYSVFTLLYNMHLDKS